MILYLLHNRDPNGGYFAAQEFKPDPLEERESLIEVRAVADFPEDVWEFALAGGLPVDVDHSNDSTWIEWWAEAEPVWSREENRRTAVTSETP